MSVSFCACPDQLPVARRRTREGTHRPALAELLGELGRLDRIRLQSLLFSFRLCSLGKEVVEARVREERTLAEEGEREGNALDVDGVGWDCTYMD